jgi:hypothetical protein
MSPVLPTVGEEIHSADIRQLTSPGLGELKRLIDQAAARRQQLKSEAAAAQRARKEANGRLKRASTFIIRLFTQRWIAKLQQQLAAAAGRLQQAEHEFEACFVDVDFGLGEDSLSAYAELVQSFESAATCSAIWDLTGSAATDRVSERTFAVESLARSRVNFELGASNLVRTSHKVLRMHDAGGRDIHFYPGFLMMRDGAAGFALIEYRELEVRCITSQFIENDVAPKDAKVLGQTWYKANKDGSRDLRFRDNYPLPILAYGRLEMMSPTGLREAYMLSDYKKARAFANALQRHQTALSRQAEIADPPPATGATDRPADADVKDVTTIASMPKSAGTSFFFDWVALGGLMLALGYAGMWISRQPLQLDEAPSETIAAAETPLPAPEMPRPIQRAQQALIAKGYRLGTPDGIMGARTHAAIRAYQASAGLATTGDLDRATLAGLGVAQ